MRRSYFIISIVAKQFTLGKKERLKSRKAIDELFQNGKRFTVPPFRVYYTITKGDALQFGVGASTKNLKKAVDRNRIKRQIREAYRLQKKSLQELVQNNKSALDLFIIYTEKELPDYQQIYAQVEKVISKISSIISENNS